MERCTRLGEGEDGGGALEGTAQEVGGPLLDRRIRGAVSCGRATSCWLWVGDQERQARPDGIIVVVLSLKVWYCIDVR